MIYPCSCDNPKILLSTEHHPQIRDAAATERTEGVCTRAWSSGDAFKESKHADYERFRDDVYAERDAPSRWAWHIDINKRFEAFRHASYADEIATVLEIAPDYLAITRETIEARPQDDHAD